MADPPSSPIPPLSPASSQDVPPTPESSLQETSPASSPVIEPPPKRKRTWQVLSSVGQPSRATRSLWMRMACEDTSKSQSTCDDAQADVLMPLEIVQVDATEPPNFEQQCEFQDTVTSSAASSSEDNCTLCSESDFESIHSGSETGSNDGEISSGEMWFDASDVETYPDSDDSDTQEDVCKLYEGSEYSLDEAVLDFMSDYFRNKESQKSLKDHLSTFTKYLPKPNYMPKTPKALFKYIESQDPTFTEHLHQYCGNCLLYLLDHSNPCEACGSNVVKTFYTFSIEDQIRHYFEHCGLSEEIDKVNNSNSTRGSDTVNDICDGSEYLKLNAARDSYSLTLMWYTDGVSVSRSSKTELWPLQFVICEVPPQLRSLYLVVCGVWCDSSKPVMNTFLTPFVDSLRKIHSNEGILWRHPKTGVHHNSFLIAPLACADAPARALIQNILGHNGKYGCNTCEQKTRKVPLTPDEQQDREAGHSVRRKRAFLFSEDTARLRDGDRMKKQAREAFNSHSVIKGVKGPTCVERIPDLNVATFLCAEYMHGVCLGVVRQFLNLWFCVAGPWSVRAHQDDIDEFIDNVKPSSDVNRILRCVSENLRWKASEYRQWLLFYSLPVLSQYLPHAYLQHWMLLVMAVFILLQEKISLTDINSAEIMLKLFVRDIGVLYRGQDYVYNVHQLLHLSLYVKRWGPLWATSAFFFEGFNGTLLQMIHGTKNPGKELSNCLRRAHGMQILKNKVFTHSLSHVEIKSKPEMFNLQRSHKFCDEDMEFFLACGINCQEFSVYSRVKYQRQTFTSLLYTAEKKRNNYTICFRSQTGIAYGEIKFFIVQNFDATENALAYIHIFNVDHSRIIYHTLSRAKVSHIIPIALSNERILCSLSDIIFKVLRVGSFVCKPPNKYERNL